MALFRDRFAQRRALAGAARQRLPHWDCRAEKWDMACRRK